MAIKKAFVEVCDFLEDNKNSKVSTVLDAVKQMCSAKSGGNGTAAKFIRNEAGEVTHVFCYYHQMWEDVREVAYGSKANSATGLNNMCKEGVSAWTKQQREAKKANAALLTSVASGDILPEDIGAKQDEINGTRGVIVPREDGHGFTDEQMESAKA